MLCQNLILNIYGKTNQETQIIDTIGYQNTHTNFKSILNSIDTLGIKLGKLGYLEHEIKSSKKLNDSTVETLINLNKKFNYIYIRYNLETINEDILNPYTTNTGKHLLKIEFNDLEYTLQSLNAKLAEHGLPFTTLKLEDIKIENDSVIAKLKTSQEEKARHLDIIVIKGYEKFPKKFIKYYSKLKKDNLFNMTNILKQTNQINKLTFANLIRDPEVLFTKDSTTLYIYVEKQKSNNFDGYIGFATNEDTNKLEFSGYVDMLFRNNLNYGETLKLLYRSDESEQKTFNVNIDVPYIFNTPIGTDLELNIFKKDSTFSTVDQSLKLYYQINPAHKIFAGLSSTQSSNLLETTTNSTINDYKSTFYQFEYNFINTAIENTFFPTKSYANIETGFGPRTYENTKENQILINTELYHTFYLNYNNSIFSRLTAGVLHSDSFLENELLYFGGINSIRGFEENSLTANLYSVLNLEYRYQLNSTMYINTITDFSYFENKISLLKEKLISFGVGFALFTNAGLLKLIYANGKTEKQPFSIDNAKIHLSLTTSF
ncbi:hypothetical protein FNB79_07295 [Formosa sediminum]|uniref:BamA/TamA family outer membrane protein n=1 Tax=Formosa sediminum TaxID=2594004 RepID=A0A516GVZ8_9FLAO|nr:hypothetical protein FNB79_07295 [Formosa sediminum]